MSPSPNQHLQRLPDYWQDRLCALALQQSDGKSDLLSAAAFRSSVHLVFPDESVCRFKHAFALADDERNELLVVTEHCGYHVFPLADLVFEHEQP